MSQRVQVLCIRKRERHNPHERIEGMGGRSPSGSTYPYLYLIESQAITAILDGTYDFFVDVKNREVSVVVALHEGRPYLKTTTDGYAPNNLLSLPECPR